MGKFWNKLEEVGNDFAKVLHKMKSQLNEKLENLKTTV